MPSKAQDIATLQKLLARAEAKNVQLQDQVKKERSKREELRKKFQQEQADLKEENEQLKADIKELRNALITASWLRPDMKSLATQCFERVRQIRPDITDADIDLAMAVAQDLEDAYIRTPQYRQFARFLKKGSEKIHRQKSKKSSKTDTSKTTDTAATAPDSDIVNDEKNKTIRDIKNRESGLAPVLNASNDAAVQAAAEHPDNAALAAAANIAKTVDPERKEFERKPSIGRQKLKATTDKVAYDLSEGPVVCPCCGADKHIDQGVVHEAMIRTAVTKLNELHQIAPNDGQHCYCHKCGKFFDRFSNDEFPVKPGRQTGLSTISMVHGLYCIGVPLNKIMTAMFGPKDQLGKDTLGRNLHDWALDSLNPLLVEMTKVMHRQHTLLMDETPFPVLQSNGQGICEAPEEDEKRKKDYIGVQCSTFSAEQRCILFTNLGSRSSEKIFESLKGTKAKVLVTDGYSSYAAFCQGKGRPILQNCCAHLRRVILDALNIKKINELLFDEEEVNAAVAKAKARFAVGSPAFLLCSVLTAFSKIYGNEATLERKPDETRKQHLARVLKSRQEYAKPLMDNIDVIMSELAKTLTRVTKNNTYESANQASQAAAAVVYYMNRRKNFQVFLTDPEVPPDSNTVERAIRPLTVLRNASNFKQSQERMDSLCIMMSLFESGKANHIEDIGDWLEDYSRAFYQHRLNRTLARIAREEGGIDVALDKRVLCFDNDSAEGFDFSKYYPWNYTPRA